MSKVMYIKYQGNKRTTTIADTNKRGFIVKQEILAQVVPVVDVVDEQAYMDMLTERMLDKIHNNHMKNKTW